MVRVEERDRIPEIKGIKCQEQGIRVEGMGGRKPCSFWGWYLEEEENQEGTGSICPRMDETGEPFEGVGAHDEEE